MTEALMAQAIADKIRVILADCRDLDAIKSFIRGGIGVAGIADQYQPYCEIFVAGEERGDTETGEEAIQYDGFLTLGAQMAEMVDKEGDRFFRLASYDLIKNLGHAMVLELERDQWRDLDGLSTQDHGSTETVVDFATGRADYGIAPNERRNNFENVATIAFVVLTQRQRRE